LLALHLGAESVDDGGDHVVNGKVAGNAGAGGGEAVIDEDTLQAAESATANVFRYADAAEAECGSAADNVAGKVLFLVPAESVRRHSLGGKGERKVPDGLLLRIE
jgi:hypothetical protein